MDDIEGVIRKRLTEIDAERRRLQAALAALTSRQPAPRRSRSNADSSTKARGGARAKPGERPRQVLAHLETKPGARPSEIATAIKASPNQVHAVLGKLRKDKLVRKRGEGYALASTAESSTPAKRPRTPRRTRKSASSKPRGRSAKS